ncbi:MAG: hypothetical protein AB1696_01415 [Planctomycetota bacterium]
MMQSQKRKRTLGADEAKRFRADEVSVALQHYLASSPLTQAGVRALKDKLPTSRGVDLDAMISDPEYMGRVMEIVEERRRCGEDAPTLLIVPQPVSPTHIPHSDFHLALIFSAEAILFQDTIQLMQLDATRWAERRGRPEFAIIGVRLDWFTTDGRATRALVTDTDGRVKDFILSEPVSFDAAMTLHLRRQDERAEHRQISAWCRKHVVPDLNPFPSAARADDKARTHRLWRSKAEALGAPAFCLIKRGMAANEIKRRVVSFVRAARCDGRCGVFIQPNTGTEGDSVSCLPIGWDSDADNIFAKVNNLLRTDDALLREERGNVRFRCPKEPDKGLRRIALRINAAWNGIAFVADSGYAQVAPDEDAPVASRGRGGSIIDINHALSNLHFHSAERWARILPSPADVENIKRAACDAATALNTGLSEKEMLRLLGIDILLETHGNGRGATLHPILLEANPRPAGLSHAREIRGISTGATAQTISLHLFEGLGSLLSRRRKSLENRRARRKNTAGALDIRR